MVRERSDASMRLGRWIEISELTRMARCSFFAGRSQHLASVKAELDEAALAMERRTRWGEVSL